MPDSAVMIRSSGPAQENLHPSTTVNVGDIWQAKLVAQRLKNDKAFYDECCLDIKVNYVKYNEKNYVKHMNDIFITEGIKK